MNDNSLKRTRAERLLVTLLIGAILLPVTGIAAPPGNKAECTPAKRKKYEVPDTMIVFRPKPLWYINCKTYDFEREGSSSGPIVSSRRYGQFFAYPHGRLRYLICSDFMGRENVRSRGFVQWVTRNRTQIFRVQLLPVHNYCFMPAGFRVEGMKLKVTLTGCVRGMWETRKFKKTMWYKWHGDRDGCGTFMLISKQ